MPRLLVDLTPLRVSVDYRRLWIGMSLSAVGTHLTTVAVGLQVYDITGSTFEVGLVGLFALVPLVVLGLYGGAVGDAHDRRRVVLASSTGLWIVALAITAQAFAGNTSVWLLYGCVALQNGMFAINSPSRSAIVPRLLPPHLLPAANALSSLSFSGALMLGPLLAGVLIGWKGYGPAYAVEALLLLVALGAVFRLPPIPPEGEVRRAGLGSVVEGLRYLGTRPNVRMTFLVDLCAMVLSMPRVLFPAIGAVHLGGGATTVGILLAGMAVGTALAGLFSGPLGHVHRQGLAVLVSVLSWGSAVVCFGLVVAASPVAPDGRTSWLLWPAAACMAWAGASDMVSSVFRNTILQDATPDAMRGRLQGVFIVVVAGGPRLGDVVLGSVAEISTEWVAAVGGGVACITGVVLLAWWQRGFARYDSRSPVP